MFLTNKYTSLYYKIITKAQSRTLDGYVERHHIIPKSLGGSNLKENLVDLTAREHFVCHLLLRNMTIGEDKAKMCYASWFLSISNNAPNFKVNNRTYQMLKTEYSIILTKRNLGKKPFLGQCHSTETKQKMSQLHMGQDNPFYGKHHSAETKQKLRDSNTGKHHSAETKQKMSMSQKGHLVSEETKRKLSKARSLLIHEKNPFNKYRYILSDGRDYWNDLTKNERITVCSYFRKKQTDNITYKDIKIKRYPK